MAGSVNAALAEREWRKALDEHAHAVMARRLDDGEGAIVSADPLGDRPTVEIQGPDGEWRRYYVRLTQVPE